MQIKPHIDSLTKIAVIIFSTASFIGCASYSRVLINNEGQAATCVISGVGIFGIAAADDAFKSCLNGLHTAGYIEIEKSGATGIKINLESPPRVIQLIDSSPGHKIGIKTGDLILQVDSIDVKNKYDAEFIMFGNSGDKKRIRIMRDTTLLEFELQLESISKINGRIKKEKVFKDCRDISDKVELYECERFKKTGK